MSKVLFITYYFPPITGSGVFRSLKFAKYLPDFDWQPFVISATEDIQLHQFDSTLLEELPSEVRVWRVAAPHPQPYTGLGRLLRRRKSVPVSPSSVPAVAGGKDSASKASPLAFLKSLFRFLTWPLRLVENPPVDVQFYWALRIIPLARRLIKQHQIDVIYTSSAPWSSLLTGLTLKWLTGRPWVLDMRDPWVSNAYVFRDKGLRRKLDIGIERLSLGAADRVIISSAGFVDEVHALGGDKIPEKVTEITNGYDEADFAIPVSEQCTGVNERRWVHLGTTILDRFEPLFRAVMQLEHGLGNFQNITLVFYGWCDPILLKVAEELDVQRFTFKSAIPHPQALTLMRQAELLILLVGSQEHWARLYPAKMFEYLRAGRPVLGIGSRGVAADLIESCGVGCFVAVHEMEKLTTILQQVACDYPAFLAQYYHPDWEMIAQYERRALTGKLAAVLQAVLKQKVVK